MTIKWQVSMRKRLLAINTFSSFIMQITTIVCGFILPRLILTKYGSEVNGLLNSISQFLQIIAFLELGVGAVVQSALYKPLAEKDNTAISEIVTSANRFFRRIAYILLAYVAVLIFIFPYISETNFDHLYTAVLIASISISAFAQYYFGVVDSLLVTANQRGYIIFASQTFALIFNTLISVILINAGASIQIVKLFASLIFLLRPIGVRLYVNRHYSINRKIAYHREPIQQKWNGIAQHIAAVVLNQTDVVVLTLLRPITDVSIYSVYNLVAFGVKRLFMSMTNGTQALLGELWAKQNKKELNSVFAWIEWVMHNGTVLIFGCAGMLIVPFVSIYTKGVSDANYIQPQFSVLLIMAHAAHCLRLPNNIMILAAGHYKQTQKHYIIATIINIVFSVLTVKRWGLNGVAFGTLLAMAYHTAWMTLYNSRNLLKWPWQRGVKQFFVDGIIVTLGIMSTRWLKLDALSYLSWGVLAIKTGVVWLLISVLVNIFLYKEKMRRVWSIIKSLLMKLWNRIFGKAKCI